MRWRVSTYPIPPVTGVVAIGLAVEVLHVDLRAMLRVQRVVLAMTVMMGLRRMWWLKWCCEEENGRRGGVQPCDLGISMWLLSSYMSVYWTVELWENNLQNILKIISSI